jgi:GntR family transcriptional regulator
MLFRLTPSRRQPLYLQLMQQIRHAIEAAALQDGDQLPGIRTLAEELEVSPGTVAKAYSELQHERLLAIHQGSGAFVNVNRSGRRLKSRVQARERLDDLILQLRDEGLLEDEIRRLFEVGLMRTAGIEPASLACAQSHRRQRRASPLEGTR